MNLPQLRSTAATAATAGSSTGTSAATPGATGSSTLGKDEFMKLLMAQLANQDPTSPSDSQAFIAQLAQFANVEQLQGANSRLDSLLVGSASSSQIAAASLVGKQVTYASDAVNLEAGKAVTTSATLPSDAKTMTATIVDAHGNTVRTMQLGARQAGPNDVVWDGRDDGGNALPPGAYRLRINATDASGGSIAASQTSRGRVTGVSFVNGVPQLIVGGAKVAMNSVSQIDELP